MLPILVIEDGTGIRHRRTPREWNMRLDSISLITFITVTSICLAPGTAVSGDMFWSPVPDLTHVNEVAVCGTTAADTVRAMRHVIALVGDSHVGLGSDFDGFVVAHFDACTWYIVRCHDWLVHSGS